jgi:surfactin synthase thioesterase subunit
VAFPHAGGSATCFFPLSGALSPDVDVLAIQYPGRQDRRKEDNVEDLLTLADLIVPEVLPYADRPLALYGHGMGATVAFEVAVRLAAAQVVPGLLLVTGRRAPSSSRDERIHSCSDADFVREVKGLGSTDSRLFDDPQTLKMILPGLRSDYRATELYRYRDTPPLECPIVALIGEDDPMVTEEEALLWGTHTAAGLTVSVMSGDHFFINENTEVTKPLRAWARGRRPALAAA